MKVVDSKELPLNDADKLNNVTAKWCIAITQPQLDLQNKYYLWGMAWIEEKVGNDWQMIDFMPFTPYEQYPAEKTSCEYIIQRYLP